MSDHCVERSNIYEELQAPMLCKVRQVDVIGLLCINLYGRCSGSKTLLQTADPDCFGDSSLEQLKREVNYTQNYDMRRSRAMSFRTFSVWSFKTYHNFHELI